MAYHSHHCSATFPCSVCLTVFLHTCIVLSVLLPFILCVPCPFNAPFLFCAFQLLHSNSFYTHESLPKETTLISSLFHFLIVSVLLMHAIFAIPLHAHSAPISFTSESFLHFTLPQLSNLLYTTFSLYSASSAHCESSA
jgi:hypothetical protein